MFNFAQYADGKFADGKFDRGCQKCAETKHIVLLYLYSDGIVIMYFF
jgi:hypothetical protein